MTDVDNDEAMAEYYRSHPDYAISMLKQLLIDGEPDEFAVILRQMESAFAIASDAPSPSDRVNPPTVLARVKAILATQGLKLEIAQEKAA